MEVAKERVSLRVGEMAARAGVHRETLRYYERRGLVPAPPRQSSGYRAYPADTVERVRLIKWAQGLGFTLREIGAAFRAITCGGVPCGSVPTQHARFERSTRKSASFRQ